MSYCAVIVSEKGDIQKVVKADGTESQLFNQIAKHPLVATKEAALEIFKNKFSKVIVGKGSDLRLMKYKMALAEYRQRRKTAAEQLERGKITEAQFAARKTELNKELGRVQKALDIKSKDIATESRDSTWNNRVKKNLPESGFKSAEALQIELETKPWGLLTAENPMAIQVTDFENQDNNEAAVAWLKEKGYNPIAIFGRYGNSENSFMVPGLTKEHAVEFAKEFNQESVATNEGLVYQDGTYYPRTDVEVGVSQDDMYSTIKTGKGNVDFAVNYNWDNKLKANGESTTVIKKSLINLDKPIISLIFAGNSELVASESPLSNEQIQNELKEEAEELQDLINCIWKK